MTSETVFSAEAPPIVFGPGASEETGFHLARLGVRHALVVTDPHVASLGLAERVRASIAAHRVDAVVFDRARVEPTEASALEAAAFARAGGFDGFVAVGGGSAIDTAKIAALLTTHGGKLLDYVNRPFGEAKPPPGPLLPLVAVPTTAGTGSEATGAAVLDYPSLGVKTGIAHRELRPRLGIVDPLLTLSLPPAVTASSGLDVLCHAIESYTMRPLESRERTPPEERPLFQGSNPISDVWCLKAIELGGRYLRRAVEDGSDLEARSALSLAATIAGIGFGNAGVHLPHAFSYPVACLKHAWTPAGYPDPKPFVPHGFSVAVTAPASFRFTEEARPERHREAARLLGGASLADEFLALMRDIGAPVTLGELGYEEADVPALAEGTLRQQRILVGAPRPVERADLERILRESL